MPEAHCVNVKGKRKNGKRAPREAMKAEESDESASSTVVFPDSGVWLGYRFEITTLPENVVTFNTALPSPYTPRSARRRMPLSPPVDEFVSGRSERTDPLNEFASSSNPVLPVTPTRTLPEWEFSS